MLKAQGIAVVYYDLPNGYMDAGEEQKKLQEALDQLVKGNPRVVYHEVDVRERRDKRDGKDKPNIKNMKLRVS
jgi:hypothetical protein